MKGSTDFVSLRSAHVASSLLLSWALLLTSFTPSDLSSTPRSTDLEQPGSKRSPLPVEGPEEGSSPGREALSGVRLSSPSSSASASLTFFFFYQTDPILSEPTSTKRRSSRPTTSSLALI